MKISVFGSTGFIGTRFCEMYPDEVLPVPKQDYTVEIPSQALYLISTTHNYNPIRVDIHTNIDALIQRLDCFDKSSVFNFVSSWFVYGDVPLPANERIVCNPKGGTYTITKLCAERLVIDHCNKNDIPWRIFRLANVFGEGDKFSKHKNALQYLINEMKHDRDIHLYKDGMFFRDYLYVDDACSLLHKGIRLLPENQIYNIGSGRPILFRDMILLAHSVLNSKSRIISMEPPDFHNQIQVREFWMDTRKIESHGLINQSSPIVRLYEMIKNE